MGVQKRGPKIVKNGPRVWAFCKIEFPGIQKPVQIFGQKVAFFRNSGNRGVGVIWLVCGWFFGLCVLLILVWVVLALMVCVGLGLMGCCWAICFWFGFGFDWRIRLLRY